MRRATAIKLVKTDLAPNQLDELFQQCKERHKQDRDKLERMMLYGQSTLCRWKNLHAYFNEPFPQERCEHCDNCLQPIEDQLGSPAKTTELPVQ